MKACFYLFYFTIVTSTYPEYLLLFSTLHITEPFSNLVILALAQKFLTLKPLGRRAHANLYPAEVYIVQGAGSSVQTKSNILYTLDRTQVGDTTTEKLRGVTFHFIV